MDAQVDEGLLAGQLEGVLEAKELEGVAAGDARYVGVADRLVASAANLPLDEQVVVQIPVQAPWLVEPERPPFDSVASLTQQPRHVDLDFRDLLGGDRSG